jgi:hypothetical protein
MEEWSLDALPPQGRRRYLRKETVFLRGAPAEALHLTIGDGMKVFNPLCRGTEQTPMIVDGLRRPGEELA